MKTCTKCGETKEVGEFYKNKTCKDGLWSCCKVCTKASDKAYREANADRVKARKAAYYKANTDIVNARVAAWAKANPDKIRAKSSKELERLRLATEFKHLGDEPVDWITE